MVRNGGSLFLDLFDRSWITFTFKAMSISEENEQ